MPAKKVKSSTCGGSSKWIGGVITILLGIALWMSYLSIEQFFAIVFILLGLMKLCGKFHC